MTRRKASYLQGLSAAPYLLPAEDHRINRSALWTPDNASPRGALGVRSGIVWGPGNPGAVTVTAGGVNINPFHAAIQGSTSTTQGVYEVTSDAVEFRAITAYSASQFRIGYVLVHVYDQVSASGAGDVKDDWDIEVVYGNPASTAGAALLPSVPATSLVIKQFAVDNNGVITLSGGAPYTVPRGGILPVLADGLAMPGHDGYTPPAGAPVQYRDHPTYGLQRWNGTAWLPVKSTHADWRLVPISGAPYFAHVDFTAGTGVAPGAGSPGVQYRREGDRVFLRGWAITPTQANGGVTVGGGNANLWGGPSAPIPADCRPSVTVDLGVLAVINGVNSIIRIEVNTAGGAFAVTGTTYGAYYCFDGLSYSVS